MTATSQLILVTGDAVCDHSHFLGKRLTADSPEPRGFRLTRKGGGALLLKHLIGQATSDIAGWKTEFGLDEDYETLPPAYHAFCLWEPQVGNPQEKDTRKQVQVWRAVEPPLGYGHPTSDADPESPALVHAAAVRGREQPLSIPPEIVVIDDAGLGFRHASCKDHWPFRAEWTGKQGPRWVVMKLSGSIGEGDLWREVVANCPDNLVLIVSADQLRRGNVRISRGLSWEATAEDLTAELQGNPFLAPLLAARHLIVTFRADGAFWLDRKADAKASMLVFDAERAEGEWAESQGKGNVFGFLSCFTAAIVRELCRPGNDPDVEAGLVAGLGASRELRRLGYGRVTVITKQPDGKEKEEDNPNPGFPFADIAARIRKPADKFVSAVIAQRLATRGTWMMLDEWQVRARSSARQRPHTDVARAVAVLGPGALERFPVARFGALQTVDRKEIESLRTIRHLITVYEKGGARKKPLSLGVFGPPGAGKSFGVTQIAKAVLGLDDEDILTFNLSQFSNAADLNGAFHRVRDRVLSGGTPLVFWDEFDSQGYRWLQYLLAPMQDGAFQDGEITHPIGKCIFVFAGATSPTYETFGPRHPDTMSPSELKALERDPGQLRDVEGRWLDFVLKKGPDFRSRLVGYLNVLGPNQRQRFTDEGGRRRWEDDETDLCYPIRRALFIRAQFKLKENQRLNLDPGVLRALLEIPHYKLGARSLEFLCQHLRQNPSGTPTRSNLPGQQLLDMHVDAGLFWEICERDLEFAPAAARLAQGLHEDWLAGLSKEQRASNPSAVPWSELDADTRGSNIAQAERIPSIVALAGLRVVRGAPPGAAHEKRVRQELQAHAEILAEAEHNHWMVERMLADWRYARLSRKDVVRKLHPLLIPYAQLPHVEQEKDRRVIRGQKAASTTPDIPDYIERLKRVGFRIETIPGTTRRRRSRQRNHE